MNLNNSDLQLKEAEQKLRESKLKLEEVAKLEKTLREADRRRKQIYEKSVKELTLKEAGVSKREKEAKYIIDSQNKILNEKAKQMTASARGIMEKQYRKREKALCETYKLKEVQLYVLTVGGLLYSFYVTALAVFTSKRFKADFKAIIKGIYSIMGWGWNNLLIGANKASNMCKSIPNESIATVLPWLVRCIIILLVLAIIFGTIGWCVYKILQIYKSNFADRLSMVVSLISFSLLVWFGDYIGNVMKCNLLLIFMIIQVVYIIIRMCMKNQEI
ncbi:MAG: DUF6040 family protein [Blautia sp.]